jgi:hypothetical protein
MRLDDEDGETGREIGRDQLEGRGERRPTMYTERGRRAPDMQFRVMRGIERPYKLVERVRWSELSNGA